MTPLQAAYELTKAWRHGRPVDEIYPVDCRLIAKELRAEVIEDDFSDKFEAALLSVGKKRVIVLNQNIREEGRKNFCIGHELGHLVLHSDRGDLRCSFEDLADVAPHPKNIEQEANCFAFTLLMPADDFREQIVGRPGTLAVTKELASRYATSLTATALRFSELASDLALTVAVVKDGVVKWSVPGSKGWRLPRGQVVPVPCSDMLDSVEVDLHRWFSPTWTTSDRLYLSSIYMERYDQHLCLLWRR